MCFPDITALTSLLYHNHLLCTGGSISDMRRGSCEQFLWRIQCYHLCLWSDGELDIHWAISSSKTTIWNKEQGSFWFTMNNRMANWIAALLFIASCRTLSYFKDIADIGKRFMYWFGYKRLMIKMKRIKLWDSVYTVLLQETGGYIIHGYVQVIKFGV